MRKLLSTALYTKVTVTAQSLEWPGHGESPFCFHWPQVRVPVPRLRREVGPVRGVLPLLSLSAVVHSRELLVQSGAEVKHQEFTFTDYIMPGYRSTLEKGLCGWDGETLKMMTKNMPWCSRAESLSLQTSPPARHTWNWAIWEPRPWPCIAVQETQRDNPHPEVCQKPEGEVVTLDKMRGMLMPPDFLLHRHGLWHRLGLIFSGFTWGEIHYISLSLANTERKKLFI